MAADNERGQRPSRYEHRFLSDEGWPIGQCLCAPYAGSFACNLVYHCGRLYFGAEKARWGENKRTRLETTLRNFVVIPYDDEIARCYGRLLAERQRAGKPIAPNDASTAGCAVRHGIPQLTHNAKDFEGISGLDVITEAI